MREHVPISPRDRRVFDARQKQAKRVEALNPVHQPTLDRVVDREEMRKHEWKGVPKMSEFADDEKMPVPDPALPLEEVEVAQVSFLRQKKCLRCKAVNRYAAIECKKCHGRLVFDKTGVDDP